MTHQRKWLFILFLCTTGLTGFHPLAQGSSNVITLDHPVHFTTVDGRDIVVHQGVYHVEATDKALRLIPREPLSPVSLEAEEASHEEAITSSIALSVPGEENEHYIVLLLPNGQSVEAIGSYTGVRSRAVSTARRKVRRANVRRAARSRISRVRAKRPPKATPAPGSIPIMVDSVSVTSGAVPFQNIQLIVRLKNLPPNSQVAFEGIAPSLLARGQDGFSGCRFALRPGLAYAGFNVNSQGRTTLNLSGWFNGQGNCATDVKFKVKTGNTTGPSTRLTAFPISISQPTKYTVNHTWFLQSKLKFEKVGTGLGFCTGVSRGILKSPMVGVMIWGASDLAMRIRSGPIGTDCQFMSSHWTLPDGVRLTSMVFEIQSEGRSEPANACCLSQSASGCLGGLPPHMGFAMNRGAITIRPDNSSGSRYSISSSDKDITTDDGVILVSQSFRRQMKTVVTPMWTRLQCGFTTPNKDGIVLVLKSVSLEGPPGHYFGP